MWRKKWVKFMLRRGHHEETETLDDLLDPKLEAPEVKMKDEMERGDLFAMLTSAWFIFIPVCLLVLLAITLIPALLFGLL